MSYARVTGLAEWRDAWQRMPREVIDEGKKIVGQSCKNIKRDWQARWEGHRHIPHLPRAITYEVTVPSSNFIHGVCGVDKMRTQGPLGNLIEFGSIHNAPIPGALPAIAAEEPRFAQAVADMIPRIMESGL